MPRIPNTNLVIDDFSIAKRDSSRVYSHILTHVHTDHLKGLYDGWNYGDIYCTYHTARLLLLRFPSLTCLKKLPYDTPTVIKQSSSLQLTITLLDANHMTGSAMALIEGYMGTILYTGDIRFDRQVFQEYRHLYPPQLSNRQFVKCSRHIDLLYLDNTFLKPKFTFPPRAHATQLLLAHIQELLAKNQNTRIYIALDSIGKEEVLTAVANHFEMLVAVEESRYEVLETMDYDLELFTTNPKESIVEVIRKNTLYQCLSKDSKAVGIILSGWVNAPSYRLNGRIYCIPYSLHSNYHELQAFMASIYPSELYPIVDTFPDENKLFYAQGSKGTKHDLMFNEQLFESASTNYSCELEQLRKDYCGSTMSKEYRTILNNVEVAKKIEEELRPAKSLTLTSKDKCGSTLPAGMQTGRSRRYKFGGQLDQLSINRLRNKIQLKKNILEGETIEVVDSGEEENGSSKVRQSSEIIEIDEEEVEINFGKEESKVDPLFANPPVPQKIQKRPSDKTKKKSQNSNNIPRVSNYIQSKSTYLQNKKPTARTDDLHLLKQLQTVTLIKTRISLENYLERKGEAMEEIRCRWKDRR